VASGAMFLLVLAVFALLIFRSLSSRLVETVLEQSRADAVSIAKKLASSGREPPLRVTERTRETESYLHSVLQEKRTVEYITVTDREGRLLFEGRSEGRRMFPDQPPTPALDLPDGTGRRSISTERDYDIAVPIENIGYLHVGVSKDAVAGRLEMLRADLVHRTAFAGVVALAALAASDLLLWWMMERNRRLELARAEESRLSELGALAAGLAHEIRNPLHAIGLNLQNLQERFPGEGPRFDAARSEVRRLDRLVDDFLLYARPAPLKLEELDLAPFLAEAAGLAALEARAHGVSIEVGGSPDERVRWDGQRIRQVVWNLIRNAVEAAAAPGAAERVVRISAGPGEGDRIAVSVEDRGPGIPPEVLEKLPALFFTTKKGGTGLGLVVADRIVRDHGGRLEISSRPGEGTSVRVTLPRDAGGSSRAATGA
jgi:signal transduction histidine kinase